MKYVISILVALCCPILGFCQDITGLWQGTMLNNDTKQYLEYEIVISKENGKYAGFSHTWFLIDGEKYYGIKKIQVRVAKDGKIILQDADLIANNYPIIPHKKVLQLNVLDLTNPGNEFILSGFFVTNRSKEHNELTGLINLKRVSHYAQSDLLSYLQKSSRDINLSMIK